MNSVEEIEARRAATAAALSSIESEKDRELLMRIEALGQEKIRRRTQERIRYYKPHLKQQAFHAAGEKYRIRIILGGNRSGKSEAGMAEVVAHALGKRLWLPENHPHHIVRHPLTGDPIKTPNRGLVVGESFDEQVKKVLIPKLIGNPGQAEAGLIPKPRIKSIKRNQTGVITEIYLDDGGSIFFKSYAQSPKLFESENYDWYSLDEPPPREHYVAIARGATDTGAPIWMQLTPLSQAWIHDELCSRSDVFKVHFDITDNIGFGLTAEAVAEFEKDLNDDEKEMRMHGRFFHLSGLIYKNFGNEHLLPRPSKEWPRNDRWQYWMHVDPHVRKRHKAVWVAIRPDGVYVVMGQLQTPPDNNLIGNFADMILAYENAVLGLNSKDVMRLIDPFATQEGVTEKGLSVKDEFEAYGLYFGIGSKKRATAIQYMRKLLHCRPEEGMWPMLYVLDDLDQVITEFKHYQYEEWKGKDVAERKDPNPEPRKKFDDYIEGIHRIVLETYSPDVYESERHGYETEKKPRNSTGY